MSDAKTLFDEGNTLFDQSDFEGAIAKYREAALLEADSYGILANLHQAYELAEIVFLRQVVEKFPDSIVAQRAIIAWHSTQWNYQPAMRLCNELMAKLAGRTDIEHLAGMMRGLHTLRLGIGTKNGISTYIVEDFLITWRSLPVDGRGRRELLKNLLSTKHPALAAAFLELAQHPEFSPPIQELFWQQAALLEKLQVVLDEEFQHR